MMEYDVGIGLFTDSVNVPMPAFFVLLCVNNLNYIENYVNA